MGKSEFFGAAHPNLHQLLRVTFGDTPLPHENLVCATACVKGSAGSRRRCESATESYSTRFANGHKSPNSDPQAPDCWFCTTGEWRRARRLGRYKARNALPMPPGQPALPAHDLAVLGKRSI